jgi:hypothetical protein
MERLEYNLSTGELKTIQLTQNEIDAIIAANQSPALIRTIDARRLRLAFLQLKLLNKVEAAILTLDRAVQVNWEYATEIKEDHPLIEVLATKLSLDTDLIFKTALELE